jgi:hypothetical protein
LAPSFPEGDRSKAVPRSRSASIAVNKRQDFTVACINLTTDPTQQSLCSFFFFFFSSKQTPLITFTSNASSSSADHVSSQILLAQSVLFSLASEWLGMMIQLACVRTGSTLLFRHVRSTQACTHGVYIGLWRRC